MWRRGLARWCLVLLLGAAGMELLARIWDSRVGEVGSLYELVVQQPGRFKLAASRRLVAPERYGDVVYQTNRSGYRDDDPRPVGSCPRVVVLGDSVSFGLGVAQDDIWPARLELELQRSCDSAAVDNLAVFAYNPTHERQALLEDGLPLQPTVVVQQIYLNDLALETQAGTGRPPRLDELLRTGWNRLVFRSAAYRRGHQVLHGLVWWSLHDARRKWARETLNAAEPRHKQRYFKERSDDEIRAFAEIIAAAEASREAGAQYLLAVFPDEVQLYDEQYDDVQARISGFAATAGIRSLDLLPILRAVEDPVGLYLDGVHLTSEGHRVAAEALGRHLAGEPTPAASSLE
jgi:lysophospholipase L1-like esterase